MVRTTKAAKATKAPATTARKAAGKASAKKGATGAKRTPPRKAPVKKAAVKKASVGKAPARKAAVKKAAVKKASVGKAPARKAAVKKAAVKKAAVKKAPVKKSPAKKAAPQPSSASRSRGGIPALGKPLATDHDRKAPPKRTGPLDKFLLDQLAALNEERITYTRQAASLKAEADLLVAEREPGDVQFDEESGEGDTLAVERERDLVLSASASAAVDDIDRAIAKIHDGTYGVCEQCYARIPKERLRALPYAALCVQCKSAGFSRR